MIRDFRTEIEILMDHRGKYAEAKASDMESYARGLKVLQRRYEKAVKILRAVEKIEGHYRDIESVEEENNGRLANIGNPLPGSSHEGLRGKLNALGIEMRRTKYFGDRGFVYSDGARGIICDYIQRCEIKTINRSIEESEYNFLMNNSVRKIVKTLLGGID
jgi:hypothetical protein